MAWKRRNYTAAQRERKLEWQRERRRATANAETCRYERGTKSGFLMRAYRNMQSRVEGVQWRKAHLYEGLALLPRADFYRWADQSSDFHTLWDKWVAHGRDRKLAPSVNRKDAGKGYVLENMEWITHSENSRQGALNRRSKYHAVIVRASL